jgi:uncharacterized protein YmfQ (DUF2313 family)
MTWQEYLAALPELPDDVTIEQWRAAVEKGKALLEQVNEKDRPLAKTILGDTLIQAGAFMGFLQP